MPTPESVLWKARKFDVTCVSTGKLTELLRLRSRRLLGRSRRSGVLQALRARAFRWANPVGLVVCVFVGTNNLRSVRRNLSRLICYLFTWNGKRSWLRQHGSHRQHRWDIEQDQTKETWVVHWEPGSNKRNKEKQEMQDTCKIIPKWSLECLHHHWIHLGAKWVSKRSSPERGIDVG